MNNSANIPRQYYDFLINRNERGFDEIISPRIKINTSGKYAQMKGFKKFIQELWTAFSDMHFEIKQEMTTTNKTTIVWAMTANNTGIYHNSFLTNKKVSASGIEIFQIENGMITEIWNYNNLADRLISHRSKQALKDDYEQWMSNEGFVENVLTKLTDTGYPLEYISRLKLKALGYQVTHRFYDQTNEYRNRETREIDIYATKELSSFIFRKSKITLNICLLGDCKYSSTNDFLVFESEIDTIPRSFPVLFDFKALLSDIPTKNFRFPSVFQAVTSFDNANFSFQKDDRHIYPGCSQTLNAFSHFLNQADEEKKPHYVDIYKKSDLRSRIAFKLPRMTIDYETREILSVPTEEEMKAIRSELATEYKNIGFLEIRIGIPIILLDKNNGLIKVKMRKGKPIGLQDVGYGLYLFSPSNLANYRSLIPEGVSEFPVLVCNLKYLHEAVKTLEKSLLAIFELVKKEIISDPVKLFLEIYYFIQRLGLQGQSM